MALTSKTSGLDLDLDLGLDLGLGLEDYWLDLAHAVLEPISVLTMKKREGQKVKPER